MPRLNRETIEKWHETEQRAFVLIPLLRAMDYHDVFEWHGGAGELGKDVVGWKLGDLNQRENLVVVAKATPLSTNVQLSDLAAQVSQAFQTAYFDTVTGAPRSANKCWIVTNKRLSKEAISRVWATIGSAFHRSTELADLDTLWEAVKIHLPVSLPLAIEETQRHIKALRSPFKLKVSVSEDEQTFSLSEAYPGQFLEEANHVSGKFEFTDSPEDQDRLAKFMQMLETGTPVVLNKSNAVINYPQEMQRTMFEASGTTPDDYTEWRVSLVTSSAIHRVSLRLTSVSGDSISLPWIEFKVVRAGTSQMTLDNSEQDYPIKVTWVLGHNGEMSSLSFSLAEGPISAVVLDRYLRLSRLYSEQCRVEMFSLTNESRISHGDKDESQPISREPAFLAAVEDFARIQTKINRPVFITSGGMSPEDIEGLDKLRSMLYQPSRETTWTRISVHCRTSEIKNELARYDARSSQEAVFKFSDAVYVAGDCLPLGVVRLRCKSAVLTNRDQIELLLAEIGDLLAASSDVPDRVEFQFAPGADDSATAEYLAWGDFEADPEDVFLIDVHQTDPSSHRQIDHEAA